LLLYSETANFFMVNQVKIYIFPNLFLQILISSYLEILVQIEHYLQEDSDCLEMNSKETLIDTLMIV
jgi:hypothetical protein